MGHFKPAKDKNRREMCKHRKPCSPDKTTACRPCWKCFVVLNPNLHSQFTRSDITFHLACLFLLKLLSTPHSPPRKTLSQNGRQKAHANLQSTHTHTQREWERGGKGPIVICACYIKISAYSARNERPSYVGGRTGIWLSLVNLNMGAPGRIGIFNWVNRSANEENYSK